ncbi:MAG: ABC transporter permease subunit [Lachnospiraceae bacterium]|nr:ABC transporter permease subunit [Lachnospiraceae bacterium]
MREQIIRAGRTVKREYLRLISVGCILVFAILPLFTLAFHVTGADWDFILHDANFWEAIRNSILYTGATAVITTVLALLAAYLLNTSGLRNKSVYVLLLTLGMLVPTISVGLGLRVLFGTNGFLDLLFGWEIEIRGFAGLIIGSVVTSFPATFLILYDALNYEDKGPYDAAAIMGISRVSTFFRLTIPYLRIALISAFFACFTLVFSDYGMPMEIAGKVKTLPMYLYDQFMSSFQYGRGSIAGFVLLIPSIISFVFDLIFKDQSVGESQKQLVGASKRLDRVAAFVIAVLCVVLFAPQLAFISLSLTRAFPNDLSFTLEHLMNIFSNTYGVGLTAYIANSLKLAGATAVLGSVFAYLLGYMSVRKSGRMAKAVDLLALSTIAIPGLVLGIGYIFLFKGTNGAFYGTLFILIVVNIFHFLGSPYLLAKNCLSKINSEYEVIGETLGISKGKIIRNVLIPNSVSTLVEMFSYFFLNSMITISAVAFLCTYDDQPLSILITTYEKNSNYEMQSVISLIILVLNVAARAGFIAVRTAVNRAGSREKEGGFGISRYEFELLTYLEKHGRGVYSQRKLSDDLTITLSNVARLVKELEDKDYLNLLADGSMEISEKGLKALEPYRVRKAIILAAGFGQRLAPVTLDTPKPLVPVNGVRILDTLLDALYAKGITNIIIVRGYKKEQFDQLLEKYPTVRLIDNPEFNLANNISSAIHAINHIDCCYICEADLYITNPDLINKYEYCSNYLGAKVSETDDWCFKKRNGYVSDYQRGGTDCYQAFGISYWNSEDAEKLKADLRKVYGSRGGRENLWEMVPLRIARKNYHLEVRKCHKSDIIEIDNFIELIAADESYRQYPGYEEFGGNSFDGGQN